MELEKIDDEKLNSKIIKNTKGYSYTCYHENCSKVIFANNIDSIKLLAGMHEVFHTIDRISKSRGFGLKYEKERKKQIEERIK